MSGSDNFIAGATGTYTAVIAFAWDGGSHSDVVVTFSSESAAAATPDGKQLMFTWDELGGAPAMIDLGVTTPGKFAVCYDLAAIYGAENLPAELVGQYMQYIALDYAVEATDATSGVINLMSYDHFGELQSTPVTYTEWNGTTCKLTCEMLYIFDAVMTVSEETVPVYIEMM